MLGSKLVDQWDYKLFRDSRALSSALALLGSAHGPQSLNNISKCLIISSISHIPPHTDSEREIHNSNRECIMEISDNLQFSLSL